MGCFAATAGVIILSGFISLSAANKDTCDIYAAVGQNLTLPFVFNGLKNTDELEWTHNNKTIFLRNKGRVTNGNANDISSTGSLLLKNLQFSASGTYKANVKRVVWSRRLCVIDKVAKPQLTYVCDIKSNVVYLNCNVTSSLGLEFSWTLDKKVLASETRQTMRLSLAQLKGAFMCGVANNISREESAAVRPTCKSSSPSPQTSLCFSPKTVEAVLAGGGGLILLLLIIIIVLSCCHKRTKMQMELRKKGELRLSSLNKQEPGSISLDYETMHATADYTCSSPKHSPRACNKNGSQFEGQTENSPVQLSAAAEPERPSPVPKPRTKITQTPHV